VAKEGEEKLQCSVDSHCSAVGNCNTNIGHEDGANNTVAIFTTEQPHHHQQHHYQQQQQQQHHEQQSATIGRHGWDYTYTTRYPGSTDTLPLGTDLPRHPGPGKRCDSLYPRPAVDLVVTHTTTATIAVDGNYGGDDDDDDVGRKKGTLQLRKALCNCINSRVLIVRDKQQDCGVTVDKSNVKNSTVSNVVGTAVDPAAATMGIYIPPPHKIPNPSLPSSSYSRPSTTGMNGKKMIMLEDNSDGITTDCVRQSPPPRWTPSTNHAATDLFTVLRSVYTSNNTTAHSPAHTPEPPRVETMDLWLDNLDPRSLSFLRISVLTVPDALWIVQMRCFVSPSLLSMDFTQLVSSFT